MKRFMFVCVATLAITGASLPASSAGAGGSLCVDPNMTNCFTTIQAALTAAHDGDTIDVAAGTYAGPITIDKNIQLAGAGAAATIIRGGGPVVTIGDLTGRATPTVSVGGVTITGGLTTGSSRGGTAIASGGGVFIPGPDTGNATAATVSIDDSVISGNRANILTVVPSDAFPCGPPKGKV